jgi:putative transposase
MDQARHLAVAQILKRPTHRVWAATKEVASSLQVHVSTVYRWVRMYHEYGEVALQSRRPGPVPGSLRLDALREAIIEIAITKHYQPALTSRRNRTVGTVLDDVERRCAELKISAPHTNTVRNRIRHRAKTERV